MAVIGVKSITGITSITNAAGGADVLTFHSNNTTEKLRITSTGQLLLGIDNAVSSDINFQIHSASSGTGPILNMTNDTGDCRIFFGQDSSGSSANAQGQIRYNVASNYLSAYTTGTEKLRITSAGLVGIGTDNPQGSLHVLRGQDGFRLERDAANPGYYDIAISSGTPVGANNHGSVYFTLSNTAGDYVWKSASNERMRLLGDTGRLGIGYDAPSYKLDVNGTGRFADDLTINTTKKIQTNSSTGQLTIQPGPSYPGGSIKFAGGQSGATDRGTLIFYAGETTSLQERVSIRSGGKVNITPGGALSGNHPPGDLNIVGTNFLTMTPNDNSNASNNEVLGQISFLPYAAGSVAAASAKIEAMAESGQSGSANPTSLKFYTKPSGVGPGSSGTERLRLTGGGQLIQYTTHTTGNSAHVNTNWYGDDANQYAIEIRDFNEMYATKTANTNSYQQIIYKREKMTHNCDIEFMLAGGSDQAGSGYYHLGMPICGDGSDTMSNFDRLVFRSHGGNTGLNEIRVDQAGGGYGFDYVSGYIPEFFDGNDRHIQIKIRGRRYSVYSDGVEVVTRYSDADNPRQNGFFGFAIYEASSVNPWIKIRDFKIQNYSLNTSLPSWDVVKSVAASTNNLYHYTVTDLNNPRTVEIRFWRLRHSSGDGRMLMRLGPSSGYITSGYYDIGTYRAHSDSGATIARGHNQGQWWPLHYDFNNSTNYYSGCITLRRISNSGRNTRIIYESSLVVDYDGNNTQYYNNCAGQMTFANSNAWDRLTFYNENSKVLNYGELEILAQH